MYNNATFVTKEQLKFLKQMDNWLRDTHFNSISEVETVNEIRGLISKIEEKGYYYEGEAELLNLMRSEYIEHTKKTKKKRL
jgi:hypothetical protein